MWERKTQKHKLLSQGIGNINQTEDQIMSNLGYYQNWRKTPSFSYGDISPLSVKSSMDIDRKKFTLSIELDKHIQYNLNHEI